MPRVRHRGDGGDRHCARDAACSSAATRSSRSRARTRRRARSRRAASTVVRGEGDDEDDLTRGMEGCALAFNVAGVNTLCVEDPRPMERMNVGGAVAAVRAAARAGVARLVHTSSAATIGEPPGTVGTERTPHRGWYLSTYERTKTEGERAALAASREVGQDLVLRQSVLGPGARARRRHRPDPARVPRRPPAGVRAHVRQPRRHRRLRRRATCSRPSAASPASATCSTG